MSKHSVPAGFPPEYSVSGAVQNQLERGDLLVSLHNLSAIRARMDSLQQFLSDSVNRDLLIAKPQMDMVSSEIASAIHQTIVNGAALLCCAPPTAPDPNFPATKPDIPLKPTAEKDELGVLDFDIVELDAVELLAEHLHFCEICGKGFKRDANLRMHMRAHGDQYKTPEALTKPGNSSVNQQSGCKTRFSCPFDGCNRNRKHNKFRSLKSVVCVRNHFKRSHCPKMYSCNRCRKKSFSVAADLKSHLKHCGEARWRCSCGTSFSRKDKLFGHVALFEGHMPAVMAAEEEKGDAIAMEEDDDEGEGESGIGLTKGVELGANCSLGDGFEGLFDGFGSIESYCLQDVLESPNGSGI